MRRRIASALTFSTRATTTKRAPSPPLAALLVGEAPASTSTRTAAYAAAVPRFLVLLLIFAHALCACASGSLGRVPVVELHQALGDLGETLTSEVAAGGEHATWAATAEFENRIRRATTLRLKARAELELSAATTSLVSTEGRFLSLDPVAGVLAEPLSTNGWTYAHANPTRYTDPTGRCVPGLGIDPCGIALDTAYEAGLLTDEDGKALGPIGDYVQASHSVVALPSEVVLTVLPDSLPRVLAGVGDAITGVAGWGVDFVGIEDPGAHAAATGLLSGAIRRGLGAALLWTGARLTGRALPQRGVPSEVLDPVRASVAAGAEGEIIEMASALPTSRQLPSATPRPALAAATARLATAAEGVGPSGPAIELGLTPYNFGLGTIADNPVHMREWNGALKDLTNSPRSNNYKAYLTAAASGKPIPSDLLQDAFSAARQRFGKRMMSIGSPLAPGTQVHHWNFEKSRYPLSIMDPRHLVMADRDLHGEMHLATNGEPPGSSPHWPWSGAVAPEHEIHLGAPSSPLP
ncbi:MAG: hypothetical protein Q8O67_31575 [Deltaproteobacteria bacterium]|nr:hypothetical protein [Deltaproteobacteria bacterium]